MSELTKVETANPLRSLVANGWKFTYDDATRYVGGYHPHGGKISVCEVLPIWKSSGQERFDCHDVGRAINRAMVQGQMYGGVAMGLGYGLLEEFDFEDGVPKQLNFDEYLIPTAVDVPWIKTIIVENPDPAGPFGAKSVGEPTNELAAPAIVNAIYNATGKRITEIPATLERVLLGHKLTRHGKRGSEQKEAIGESCKVGRESR